MQVPEQGHEPVMVREVLDLLRPAAGEVFVDATVGRGGHARAIAERLRPGGTLLALDVDPANLAFARERLRDLEGSEGAAGAGIAEGMKTRWFQANFAEIEEALSAAGIPKVDGLLADLGVSTNQLLEAGKGLSFTGTEPLDMRLDPRIRQTAADLVADLAEQDLANLLFENAQERFSRRIARKIVQTRVSEPIRTTSQLARLVRAVIPARPGQIDPATRTFQALRMAVNAELESLEGLLQAIPRILRPGGRAVIISFHSGEDRLVKQALRNWASNGMCAVLTKKPLEPADEEMQRNPRSRSAKLRAVRWGSSQEPVARSQ